jgi:hypothetical protein
VDRHIFPSAEETMKALKLNRVPEYDILEEAPLNAVLGSAERLLSRMCQENSDAGNWNLRESVWPAIGALEARDAKYLEIQPRLVLLPLDRIGAKGGFSGSKIMLGYFSDEGSRIFSSLPLVIKLAKREGVNRKLVLEQRLAQSIRPYLGYYKDSFAVPIHLDVIDPEYDVLWSPFALPELIRWGTHLELTAKDLRQLLERGKSMVDANRVIASVFNILEPLHRRVLLGARYPRSLADEYAQYLRGFREKWGPEWIRAWGEEKHTADLGRDDWTNPIWVLNQLSIAPKVELLCGAVHGDLHPGNILYSDVESPSVIDFGWADADAHVAKDFVLLECNLRFTHMRGDVPLSDIRKFSRWIGFNAPCDALEDKRSQETQETIKTIRSRFQNLVGEPADLDIEYVIPMFFVAFGLLRYVEDYTNQVAARLTVLELAEYIEKFVFPKLLTES